MFTDFHHAFHWLMNHRVFLYAGELGKCQETSFPHTLDIAVIRCDCNNEAAEVTGLPAVKTQVWLEVCGFHDPETDWEKESVQYRIEGVPIHLWSLDCGGDTFEEAICHLATEVYQQYGNDPIEPNP